MRTELYWISGPWPGRLAIGPRPRGGDWLGDEIRAWKEAGAQTVVSLLTADEIAELDLLEEQALCRAAGLNFIAFPLKDRGVPASRLDTAELVRSLESMLQNCTNIVIHCRAGVGRSALIAACLLTQAGLAAEAAFQRIGAARGCVVPDTAEQKQWVARFASTSEAAVR